jgi:hypothetical protein
MQPYVKDEGEASRNPISNLSSKNNLLVTNVSRCRRTRTQQVLEKQGNHLPNCTELEMGTYVVANELSNGVLWHPEPPKLIDLMKT